MYLRHKHHRSIGSVFSNIASNVASAASSVASGVAASISGAKTADYYRNVKGRVLDGLRTATFVSSQYTYRDFPGDANYTWEFDEEGNPWIVGYDSKGSVVSTNDYYKLIGIKGDGVNLAEPRSGTNTRTVWDFAWIGIDGYLPRKPLNMFIAGRLYGADGSLSTSSIGTPTIMDGVDQFDRLPSLWNMTDIPAGFAKGYLLTYDDALSQTRDPRTGKDGTVIILGPQFAWTGGQTDAVSVDRYRRYMAAIQKANDTGKFDRVIAAVDIAGNIIACSRRSTLDDRDKKGPLDYITAPFSFVGSVLKRAYQGLTSDVFDIASGWVDNIPVIGPLAAKAIDVSGGIVRFPLQAARTTFNFTGTVAESIGIPREALIAGGVAVLGPAALMGAGGALVPAAGFVGTRIAVGGMADKMGLPASIRDGLLHGLDTVVMKVATVGMADKDAVSAVSSVLDSKAVATKVMGVAKDLVTQYGPSVLSQFDAKNIDELSAKLLAALKAFFEGVASVNARDALSLVAAGRNKFVSEVISHAESAGIPYADAFRAANAVRLAAKNPTADLMARGELPGTTFSLSDVPEIDRLSRERDELIRQAQPVMAGGGLQGLGAITDTVDGQITRTREFLSSMKAGPAALTSFIARYRSSVPPSAYLNSGLPAWTQAKSTLTVADLAKQQTINVSNSQIAVGLGVFGLLLATGLYLGRDRR